MGDPVHRRIAQIFARASELSSSDRDSYLNKACGDDANLRHEVEQLLDHENAGTTLLAAPGDTRRLEKIGQTLTMPETVGAYRLLYILGDGGMAIVYLAQQHQPQRLVALKMIKPGMDSAQILRRFDSEREALASMRHAGIATIFDAGLHTDGRSYFVMEYVDGTDIVTFCRAHTLTMHERLMLMIQVCEATTHAHQKGVIHRDLKPSNILVTHQDVGRQPKIIDFGIARITRAHSDDNAELTQHNQVVGTPDYMSPEQATANAPDIDTRTDVYSIGVVLHELLVGRRPQKRSHTGSGAGQTTFTNESVTASKTLRKVDPQELAQLARERACSPRKFVETLDGDLNWILNKSLETERDRRYATVSALAEDLDDFLHGRAVSAHPPSRRYQLRCFLRNHAVGVGVTAAALLGLAVSTIGLAIGFNRAEDARWVAVEAQRTAVEAQQFADRQSELARLESQRANEVTEFLIDLFDVASPSNRNTSELNARELLLRGVENIQSGLQNQPLVRASMLETMARVHLNLGQYAEAEPLASKALTLTQAEQEQYLPARIQAHRTRGLVHFYQGEYQAAESMYRRALDLHHQTTSADDNREAELKHNLGNAIFEQGQLQEALTLFEDALRMRMATLPDNHTKIAESLNSVASAERRLGNLDAALGHYQQALRMRQVLNQHVHPATAITLSNLGVIHFNLRQFDQAESYLEQALQMQRQVFSDDHPQIGTVLANLGATLAASKQLDKASRYLVESVAWHRKTLGADHPNTANALLNLGSVMQRRGELTDSEALFRESIEIYTQSNTGNTPTLGIAMANLSELLLRQNRPKEALSYAEASHSRLLEILPETHPWLAVAKAAIGAASAATGDQARARKLLAESLPILEKTFGSDGSRTTAARTYLQQLDSPVEANH